MVHIKFYAHMVFEPNAEMPDMLRSIDIVGGAVETVAKVFQGESIYVGTGEECVQYNDTVRFKKLSDTHKAAILKNYPFARVTVHS